MDWLFISVGQHCSFVFVVEVVDTEGFMCLCVTEHTCPSTSHVSAALHGADWPWVLVDTIVRTDRVVILLDSAVLAKIKINTIIVKSVRFQNCNEENQISLTFSLRDNRIRPVYCVSQCRWSSTYSPHAAFRRTANTASNFNVNFLKQHCHSTESNRRFSVRY
jgi:hypothetical protein